MCAAGPTGNRQVDIAFSDPGAEKSTLLPLGRGIKAIHATEPDEAIRHWVLMTSMTRHFPQVMAATMADDLMAKIDADYRAITFPPVEWVAITMPRGLPPTRQRRIGCVLIGIVVLLLFIAALIPGHWQAR